MGVPRGTARTITDVVFRFSHLRCRVSCSRLPVAVLFISIFGRCWNNWLYLGSICVLYRDGGNCSSIIGGNRKYDVPRSWILFIVFIGLLDSKLASSHNGRVLTRFPTSAGLVVSLNF